MPSSATITAFYSFTANTKARATQVNNNFDAFRGHIIPINPNTATAAGSTYDLGSTEHRWRTGYFQSIDFQSNTTTGNALSIIGETTAATPAFVFKVGSTEVGRVATKGLTLSAAKGGFGISGQIEFNTVGVSGAILVAGSTLTIATTGNPVHLLLAHNGATAGGVGQIQTTHQSVSAATPYWYFKFSFLRDAATVSTYEFKYDLPYYTSTAINPVSGIIYGFAPTYHAVDTPAAGTYNYSISVDPGYTHLRLLLRNLRLYAKEW